jgi:ABC-type multidrug transport system fused ATPase/permease subunit
VLRRLTGEPADTTEELIMTSGRRLQRLIREAMQLDAETGAAMTERFNVAGAMLVKLFGDPASESRMFARRAARVRDIGVTTAMCGTALIAGMTLLAALAMAVAYGLGGWLVIRGSFQLGASGNTISRCPRRRSSRRAGSRCRAQASQVPCWRPVARITWS